MPAQAPCPKCRGAFVEIDRNGIKIDVCQECRGVFLDRGELDQIIAADQRAFSNVYDEDESFFRHLAGQGQGQASSRPRSRRRRRSPRRRSSPRSRPTRRRRPSPRSPRTRRRRPTSPRSRRTRRRRSSSPSTARATATASRHTAPTSSTASTVTPLSGSSATSAHTSRRTRRSTRRACSNSSSTRGRLKNSDTPPAAHPRRLVPPTLLTWQSHASRARAGGRARCHWRLRRVRAHRPFFNSWCVWLTLAGG